MTATALTVGSRLGGAYELERQLGQRVWHAWDHGRGVAVMLKLFPLGAAGARAAFDEAAAVAVQLGHSSRHIVKVFDHRVLQVAQGPECGEAGMLVMEALAGETLAQKMEAHGRLSVGELRPIVGQLALALKAMHATGVLHLGLRPECVFVAQGHAAVDGDVLVKLLGCGLSPLEREPSLRDSVLARVGAGARAFTSPEQIRADKELTAAADIWSATATVYAAAVGQPPFGAPGDEGVEARILWKQVPAPSSVLPRGSQGLDMWVERGMAREPQARFASADEFAAAFEAIAVSDGPAGPWWRRWQRS